MADLGSRGARILICHSFVCIDLEEKIRVSREARQLTEGQD